MTTPNHTEATAALAATLYPDAAPPSKATASTPEVAALRSSDPARQFYSDASNLGEHNVRELALAINPTGTVEVVAQRGAELAATMADLGMNGDDVARLARLALQFRTKPPSAVEVDGFHRTAFKELRETYGDKNFDQALSDARGLARRDPRLSALLNSSGMGDHPWLVSRLAELGRTARQRGQLK